MSFFRKIVEKATCRQNTSKILLQSITTKKLNDIFCITEQSLLEDKNSNKNALWLARTIYNKFIEQVKTGKYERTKFGGIVNLENFDDLEIEFSVTGNAGDGVYSKDNNSILVYTNRLNDLENDLVLRNALIHEITHSISYDDENNIYRYISPDVNRKDYLLQPLEFEANKIALLDYLVNRVLKELKELVLTKDLENDKKLQEYINKILSQIMKEKSSIYREILFLMKEKNQLKDFYKEIVETCIEYIHENLTEMTLYSVGNDFKKYLNEQKKLVN